MTTQLAIGALVLGLLFWLLSAYVHKRIEEEFDFFFICLLAIGITLTAAGFFYFLPVDYESRVQNAANIILYIFFVLGGFWASRKISGDTRED